MRKLFIILSICSVLFTGCVGNIPDSIEDNPLKTTEGITVVPTLKDEITSDSTWCATFQLVWNDMKNEVVGQDVIFNPQLDVVDNLNDETFTEDMISEEYYFKIYGLKSLELKEKIENGIKEKFNETSDILEDFDWSEDALDNPDDSTTDRYFFYTMLKREFEFPKVFTKLENGMFADKYSDVKYFGIDSSSDKSLYNQVRVLYYNSKDDFAVLLVTKDNDEVILCKSPKGNNFEDIYNNLLNESEKYKGNTSFKSIDELKVPNISFNEKRVYEELANKPFPTADGDVGIIMQAIQTIQFDLNEKGGKIKSEAAIDMIKATSIAPVETPKPRYFYLDDTFAMFLKEKDKDVPYFATVISDITKFQ